ncbi:MAG TPA: TRAP transporter large permease [Candidatus Avidesulfovibrio excrementigallinarum]|nr:TRAP transporter large permease [Candidatus Avidesulfovibrio excrementigallinarum]
MEIPIVLTLITMVVLLVLSAPIAVAIGLSVIVGCLAGDLPVTFVLEKMVSSLDSFPLLAVPFFILAGEIMQKGTMADALLRVSRCLVGHIPGGMAHVSILTCMFYGALSGSSPATVAAVGGIMIPAMEKDGYPKDFSTAVNVSAGCLGVMIPPSVPLIIYGAAVGVSVSDLFIAGILPGIFVGVCLMVTSYFIVRKRGIQIVFPKATKRETLRALWDAKHALMVPLIVLGGIYGGIFTPTEAGAMTVAYALLAEGLLMRSLTWRKLYEVLKGATVTNATIFIIMCCACALGQLLLIYNVSDAVANMLECVAHNKYALIAVIILIMLIAGTFMEALANIIILAPLMFPMIKAAGIDPIHFGIIMIVSAAMGFLTPPVGVNLFVGCGISKMSIEKLSIGVIPYLVTMLVALGVLVVVPQISLLLL